MCRLNLGGIRQYLGRLPAARADLESALALGESIGHTQGQAYALLNLADLEVTRGDYAAALERCEQAADLERRVDDQHLRVLIAAGASYALTLLGHPAQAIQRLDAISWQGQGTSEGVDWDLAQTAYGFAAYHLGNLAQASETLTWVCEHTRTQARHAERARAQVILAAVLSADQRTVEAEAVLQDALDASAALDGGPTLLLDARLVPALWTVLEAMDHSVAPALLAQFASEKKDGESVLAHDGTAPGAIEAWALDDAHVHMNGRRVIFWPRAQTSELFFFLLDQRQPVSREVILASVWEDTDPKVADADFRRARSELKKALGQPWLEHKDGRWRVTLTYWLDVHEFEGLADEGERLAKEGHISAAAAAIRQALELWTGQFLDDAYTNWATSRREALAVRRLDLLERLAELDILLHQYDEAAACCHKLLDAEPYRESGHRGLMLCYVARGEPSRAMAQYRRCVETLRTELGVAPDARTTALGSKIRAKILADAAVKKATSA
jgi:DNA-binding SARP family transcriptional activator